MTAEMRHDGGFIADGRAVAANVAGFDMGGGSDQFVAVPYAGGEAGLIVRSVLRGCGRPSIQMEGSWEFSGFPCTDDPGLNPPRERIGHSPHPQAERSGRDMPLRLEPANALRFGDLRLFEA